MSQQPHVLYAGPPVGPRISDQPDARALSATLEEMAPHLTVHDQRNVASAIRLYHAHLFGNLTKPATKSVWFVLGGAGIRNQGDGLTLDAAINLARVKAELGYPHLTIKRREVPDIATAEPKRQWLVRAEMDFKTFKIFDTFMDAAREIDLLSAAGHLVVVQYGERTP